MAKKKENTANDQTVLSVSCNPNTGNYSVKLCKGSSVNEAAFCVHIVIRCLLRDKHIATPDEFLSKVRDYLNDVQWNEVDNANKKK